MTGRSDIEGQYGRPDLRERISAALVAAGRDPGSLTVVDTAPFDEFHTLGRQATVALAELAGIGAADHMLDIGAGLGGAARYLADRFGCRVTTLDITPEFCAVARWLDASTRLDGLITVICGDALSLPVATGSVDVVWTQHVQMNVAAKAALYREARRALRNGGRLALWELVAGQAAAVRYPQPWADTPEMSHLTTAVGLQRELRAAGFDIAAWNDLTEAAIPRLRSALAGPRQPLGLHVVVPGFAAKAANLVAGLADGSLRLVQAVAVAGDAVATA